MRKILHTRGTMAIGSMIIVLGSILTAGTATAVIFSAAQSSGDHASAVVDDTLANLCDGLAIVDATGHYSHNNLTSLEFIMKTLPGSDPINMQNITIIVYAGTNETIYALDNSSYSFLTHIYNGDNGTIVTRGELLQLTIPNLLLHVGEEVTVVFVPSMGENLTINFAVPDNLGNDFVLLT